jgi:hypothetical protein
METYSLCPRNVSNLADQAPNIIVKLNDVAKGAPKNKDHSNSNYICIIILYAYVI